MRKSHRQKVADRKAKKHRRGRQRFYDGLVSKFKGQLERMKADPLEYIHGKFDQRLNNFRLHEDIHSPQWAVKGDAFIRENMNEIFPPHLLDAFVFNLLATNQPTARAEKGE